MKNWFKKIETKKHDVLVQRLSDNDNEEHISISFLLDGTLVCYKPGFGDQEEKANEAFMKFSKKDAEKMIKETKEMLKPEKVVCKDCGCDLPDNYITPYCYGCR